VEIPKVTSNIIPWEKDHGFQALLPKIQGRTLIDIPRLYTLWVACHQTNKFGKGAIAEVGVYKGGSGALLCLAMNGYKKQPLYLIDTFKGIVKAGPSDNAHKNGDFSDTSYKSVVEFIESIAPGVATILAGTFPDTITKLIDEKLSFRLVHCDVDVHESTYCVLDWFIPRMVPGGMIIVDDYGFDSCQGARLAVNEFLNDPRVTIMYNFSGQAVLTKTAIS
jgi:O-methyltransferase